MPAIVDIHAHMLVPVVESLVGDRPERTAGLRATAEASGEPSAAHNARLFREVYWHKLTSIDARLAHMDAQGVDVQALSISPTQYYYWADVDLARDIVAAANTHLAEACAAHPNRLVGLATVALQHPELAAQQLTHAVKELGLKGCQVSTAIAGAELADRRHDVFWRRAEELSAVVFVHPLGWALGSRRTIWSTLSGSRSRRPLRCRNSSSAAPWTGIRPSRSARPMAAATCRAMSADRTTPSRCGPRPERCAASRATI
jgi:aminocarboxymuconate-semialdehyde decarboxylase